MRKLLIVITTIPILLVILSFISKTTVQFLAADWDTAKNKAISEQKLYFVDFDANYCATCRNMDQSTYMSENLANYMQNNVVALRVDVQDFDGVMWSQQYEVEALPTILIFNEKGELVKRIVGYKSADDLLEAFKTASISTQLPPKKLAPVVTDGPMAKAEVIVETNTSSFMDDKKPSVIVPQGKGLFDVVVKRQASKNFGVQVGVFSNYETVLEQASLFKRKYASKQTLIHIDIHNGSTVYKLLLGTFPTKRDAYNFRGDLRREGGDGLLKDLRYLG